MEQNAHLELSLSTLADATGLARRTVQLAIAHLKRRHLIHVMQAHVTATPQVSGTATVAQSDAQCQPLMSRWRVRQGTLWPRSRIPMK